MSTETCTRIQRHLSLYLDDRLSDGTRRQVSAHLAGCEHCHREHAALAELSRRVRTIPVDETDEDLARRVRDAAARADHKPAWAPRRAPSRVAVAAVAALLVVAAYLGGRLHGTSLEREQQDDASIDEVTTSTDAVSLRAAQSLLSDLATIDKVDPPARRPLLAAQMRHFGFGEWSRTHRSGADADLGAIASIVARLHETLESPTGDDTHLLALRKEALDHRLWRRLRRSDHGARPEHTTDPEGARISVEGVAGGFPPEFRKELREVIALKESFVHGHFGVVIDFAQRNPTPGKLRFGPSLHALIGTSYDAAGLPELAKHFFVPPTSGASGIVIMSSEDTNDPIFPFPPAGRFPPPHDLHDQLERFFRESGTGGAWSGSGEVIIEESSDDGSYSYKITIQTADGKTRELRPKRQER